eukprot:16445962-Heterocapsa_arctica.AAC.1
MGCAGALRGMTARVLITKLTPAVPVEGGVVGMARQAPRHEYAQHCGPLAVCFERRALKHASVPRAL